MSSRYVVEAGDTLSAIARRHGLSLAQLLDVNPQFRADPNLIVPGQQVNLPFGILAEQQIQLDPVALYVQQVETILATANFKNTLVAKVIQDCECDDSAECLVTGVSGPDTITVGTSATYTVSGFQEGANEKCCKKRVRWQVEVYAAAECVAPLHVIEDCSIVSAVFTVTPGTLKIKKVPDFWYCRIRVYAYVAKPITAVSKITAVKIAPKLLAASSRNNTDDLQFGDYKDKREKVKALYDAAQLICVQKAMATIAASQPYYGAGLLISEATIRAFCPDFSAFEKMSDKDLFAKFESLVRLVSMGDLETVAVDMVSKVRSNQGGEYRNATLNSETRNHDSPIELIEEAQRQFEGKLSTAEGQIDKVTQLELDGWVSFAQKADNFKGLGILIHDTESYRIELISYVCKPQRKYKATLRLTIRDHFGLDVGDVSVDKKGYALAMHIAPLEFMAWFYLQRVRGYRPLVTVIENDYDISGSY